MPATVACAIVHDDPPEVFIAEDIETLNWILVGGGVALAAQRWFELDGGDEEGA